MLGRGDFMSTMKKKEKTKKRNDDPNSLTGRHIYRDEKGRVLHYNERTMTGYIIKAEHVVKYRQLSSRLLLGLLATLVTSTLFLDWGINVFLSVPIGVAFYALLEYRFRKQFLPSLVKVEHFIPKEKPSMIESYAQRPSSTLMIKAALLLAFGILMVVDIELYLKPETYVRILSWIISACACAYALFHIYVLLYKKKHSIS